MSIVNVDVTGVFDEIADLLEFGTCKDHVAPWRSLSAPGHAHRNYQILHRANNAPYVPPDAYMARAARVEGSGGRRFNRG